MSCNTHSLVSLALSPIPPPKLTRNFSHVELRLTIDVRGIEPDPRLDRALHHARTRQGALVVGDAQGHAPADLPNTEGICRGYGYDATGMLKGI
jgi:hypothetical protein